MHNSAYANGNWKYFIDQEDDESSLKDVLSLGENQLTELDKEFFSFGFKSCPVWFRLNEINGDDFRKLVINKTSLNIIDFHLIENGELLEKVETGTFRRFNSRQVESPYFVFELPDDMQDKEVWLKIQSTEDLNGAFHLLDNSSFLDFTFRNYMYSLVPLVIVLSLIVIYSIIFVSLRDKIYLIYIIYAISACFALLRINGFGFAYLWSGAPIINQYSAFFEAFGAITATVFAFSFLQLKRYMPMVYKFMIGLLMLHVIMLIVCLAGFNQIAFMVIDGTAIIFFPLAIISAVYVLFRHKFEPAFYYLISWVVFILGIYFYVGQSFGLLQLESDFLKHAVEFGAAGEMMLISIGVTKRFDRIRKDRIAAQTAITELVQKQNEKLEEKVEERTRALEHQNKEIIAQQEEIQTMNNKLEEMIQVRTEKLESQNRILTEYAYFNAHKVRGPLARILGLLNLYKHGHEKDLSSVFDNIDVSAKQLDVIIKEINASLTIEDEDAGELINLPPKESED